MPARRCYHFTLSHWKSAMTLATASCPRRPWDQEGGFKDPDQFGLKSRFGDQRQMRLGIGRMTRCLGESAVTCGSEFGAVMISCCCHWSHLRSSNTYLWSILLASVSPQIGLGCQLGGQRYFMLITPTQLPKVVRNSYPGYSPPTPSS